MFTVLFLKQQKSATGFIPAADFILYTYLKPECTAFTNPGFNPAGTVVRLYKGLCN